MDGVLRQTGSRGARHAVCVVLACCALLSLIGVFICKLRKNLARAGADNLMGTV